MMKGEQSLRSSTTQNKKHSHTFLFEDQKRGQRALVLRGQLHGNRAQALLGLERYAEALEDAQESIEADPTGSTKGYWRAGKAALALGRWEESKELCRRKSLVC